MKLYIISIALLAIALTGCSRKNSLNSASEDSIKSTVVDTNSIIGINSTDTAASSIDETNKESNHVQNAIESIAGTANYKRKYCGGMRPTPEVEEKYIKQYPLAMCNIKLVSSNNAVVFTKTDANGNFVAALSKGVWNYWLISTPGSPVPIDMACEKYFDHSFGSFEISDSESSNIHLLFSFPCDPCDPYSNMRP